ncbi:MAG TPA: hypothetical protein DCL95_00695 [Rhodospirillaceae bacterium]|nr:hypothetical protein [Rhodospirillaceae bacterium]MAX63327.1 hypothetical protein [Rhodospirillaceae bacterium]MBB59355.1 hypothetical protein [Rhodospirillaceae bacterium]HAJ18578.1 hypothetical protein [Rhodospirillaceae bacterium]HBM12387.1 hypothetical protein [Rhodospirillaceae bacterium]
MKNFPSIRERALTLFVNSAVAYALFVTVTGVWLPTGAAESVWILCAIPYWFLSLFSAPWFLPPRDVVASGITSLLLLTTMDIGTQAQFAAELEQIKGWGAAYTVLVVFLAIVALFLHDKDQRSSIGRFAFKLTNTFGCGEILFSLPAVISIIVAYQASFAAMAWLLLFWLTIMIAKPIERIVSAVRQLNDGSKSEKQMPTVGVISRVDHPNIIRVKLSSANAWKPNCLFTASMPDGSQRYAVSLFSQIQGIEVVGTGLCVAEAQEMISLPAGSVCRSHDDKKTAEFLANLSGSVSSRLVGFVVENSNIGVIAFEIAANAEIKEGDVVFVRLSNVDVFYQIIGAETFEESFDQNPRGTHVVRASQLGVYSAKDGFTKYAWLPSMNIPIFSAESRTFQKPHQTAREFAIGKVPSTNIEAIANIDELVEYHSAVLGVTGTGKTELALDIVREAVKNGVKVFCVDFTGDYKHRLNELNPCYPAPTKEEATTLEAKLFDVETGKYGAPEEKKILKEGLDILRESTREQINTFLKSKSEFLAIFELPDITNTKASLRLTELYLSSIMEWARANRRARKVLIVLEEAHTIIPEVFGSGFDADTQYVVSRIGQIALQGRKYGVGLMVISQRTALVSKTILSQCNTFLTHSLIDQTSLTFLESVYSAQHTRLIPNLGRFEFLAYGKAIKAERPIILRRDFDQKKLDASLALSMPLSDSEKDENNDSKEDRDVYVEEPKI